MNILDRILSWFMGSREKDEFRQEMEEIKKQMKLNVKETGSFKAMISEIDARMKARQLKKLSLKELMD